MWLPRLDVSFKSSLREPLQNLGMQIAFDPRAADFSRMIAGSGPGDFFIGEVLHQAVLKLDETGTEAAAVTSIEVRLTSAPAWRFSFRADRPFLLALRDDETGARPLYRSRRRPEELGEGFSHDIPNIPVHGPQDVV